MSKLARMLVALFFAASAPAVAATSTTPVPNRWLVTQLSGDARVVHPGVQAISLKVNSEIEPGDTLMTGPSGRATLVRGADYIVIAPRSELRLPTTPQPSGFTRVIQNLGTMLFKIQHTGVPHFAVDTPMLAAVVKGTTFTVVVDQSRSAVQVIQGVVQVNAAEGGMMRMVEGGRTVFINHDNPKMLYDADKPTPSVAKPSSSTIRVSAAGPVRTESISTLTGGLIRAEQAPVSSTTAARPVEVTSPLRTAPALIAASKSVGVPAAPSSTQPAPGATTPVGVIPGGAPTSIPVVAAATGVVPPPVVVGNVTTPVVTLPPVATPSVTPPSVSVTPPSVSVMPPSVSVTPPSLSVTPPSVSVTPPSVSVTAASVSLTTPTITVTPVTTPAVTVPSVTTPSVSVSTPTIPVAPATTPAVTVPQVTTAAVAVPSVSTPTVTTPVVTAPSVTTPEVTVSTPALLGR